MNTAAANTDNIKKRRPILAGMLSLLLPGLGHVYAGNLSKGLWLTFGPYALIMLASKFLDLYEVHWIYTLLLCFAAYYLYCTISSFLLARRNQAYKLKPFNKWYVYIAIFIVAWVCGAFLTRHYDHFLGYKTYKIPSGSMHPTLQIGDYITVDTRYNVPAVGDIVVFPLPSNKSVHYTHRVVAVGGDTISINNGVVTLNGVEQTYGDATINIGATKQQRNIGETVIPDGEFFVLGDNRHQSNDSRYWGNVQASEIIGKVRYVWYSKDKSRIGKEIK